MLVKEIKALFIAICLVFWANAQVFSTDIPKSNKSSPAVSFYHPSGMNGFIIYDVNPSMHKDGLGYRNKSLSFSSPLGLPVTVEVEGYSVSNRSDDPQEIFQDTESNYLEIFSIQHALNYGTRSSLSPKNADSSDITMVVASANYQATDRLAAKLSTGVSQTINEKIGSASSLGYELDITGLYEIAPGLSFSVGAGYATNLDSFKDSYQIQDGKRTFSLISKLRLKF